MSGLELVPRYPELWGDDASLFVAVLGVVRGYGFCLWGWEAFPLDGRGYDSF